MKNKKDSLGDRMKAYENVSKPFLTLGVPKIVRLDMRAGHTFCRNFIRPFDDVFSQCMVYTAKVLCEKVPGAVFAYTQSDEISIVMNDITEKGEIACFFDGNVEKIVSVTASIATKAFNRRYMELVFELPALDPMKKIYEKNLWEAEFDSRTFCLPSVMEVHNYILWRQNDATRNSIQMVGHANFSQKEMHGKNCGQIQDMLMLEKEINWNDFPAKYKRGALIAKERYEKISAAPGKGPMKIVTAVRTRWIEREIPILTKDKTIVARLFSREQSEE